MLVGIDVRDKAIFGAAVERRGRDVVLQAFDAEPIDGAGVDHGVVELLHRMGAKSCAFTLAPPDDMRIRAIEHGAALRPRGRRQAAWTWATTDGGFARTDRMVVVNSGTQWYCAVAKAQALARVHEWARRAKAKVRRIEPEGHALARVLGAEHNVVVRVDVDAVRVAIVGSSRVEVRHFERVKDQTTAALVIDEVVTANSRSFIADSTIWVHDPIGAFATHLRDAGPGFDVRAFISPLIPRREEWAVAAGAALGAA